MTTTIKDTTKPATPETEEANQLALENLLSDIEKASQGITRDKGTRFETLIKDWLRQEPTYRDLFTEVLTYKEWNEKYQKRSGKDIGIDLVGVNANGEGFTAIQCKLYDKNATVPKSGIDSFLAASGTKDFTARFLVATNANWTENVRNELLGVVPPVTLITRETLAQSTVDWNAYRKGETKLIAKRTPRDYQIQAIDDVLKGFKSQSRGKLIMACGTGKTYTSLKIAEEQAGKGKLVLFLVPSLSLLSQTLTDWKQQCIYPINAFAVCSDNKIGKADLEDTDSLTESSELSYPATTNEFSLAKQVKKALQDANAMTVVFSTYQSIDVIHRAQKLERNPLKEFDLVICDEAHRTAGGHHVKEEETQFTRIHDNDFVKAAKRLYMTATPRIYGEIPKKQKEEGEVVLYSMDDEEVFGKDFHCINFRQAVQMGSLVDYKVIVLTVDESMVGDRYESNKENTEDELEVGSAGGIPLGVAAKIIGCWRALSKRDLQGEISIGDDLSPMRRAVGFAQVIEPSERAERVSSKLLNWEFKNTVERFKAKMLRENKDLDKEVFEQENSLICDTNHIDGSMDATEKAHLLDWLRETPEEDHCKILFNVRCLSEGVDVPALDAVLFLSPRKSQVDVVQTVGRVMRTSKATNKKRGYVIIPIVTPAGLPPNTVLDNNKDFETVWQILRALKSIDEDFGIMIDGQLQKINPDKMEVICLTNKMIAPKGKKPSPKPIENKKPRRRTGTGTGSGEARPRQIDLALGRDMVLEEAIRARIVKKVGNRKEWSDWAEDVGQICKKQVEHIKKVLDNPENTKAREKFEEFSKDLKGTLNGELSKEEILDMLGQHIVTKPVMDAIFSDFPFTEKNPVAKALTSMLSVLDKEGMKSATKLLENFYKSVNARAKNIKTQQDRQTVILELFDKFFKLAFPKLRDKLGIVYTPVQVVDFINQSVADILKKEFGTDIADPNVHILDPFTGTGTFLTRLMQSGLIPKDKLEAKFKSDIHANEIVPLAYYVASMNLESTLHELLPDIPYEPNQVMVWTDTFADHDNQNLFAGLLKENNERLNRELGLDIRVIVGNPPYSVGQERQADNNANEHYERLDNRIQETYVAHTQSSLKRQLYDSYIRAYRWASDRIGDKGVIGFVTNAGWVESNSADGMRKCMAKEFNSIYVFHLKGNQRTSGERSRREGGKIFGEGSRAPVAIVILVKNPKDPEKGKIYFHGVDDYLSRDQKLEEVDNYGSIANIPWKTITPDGYGDWLNQRNDFYSQFLPMGNSKAEVGNCFYSSVVGLSTNRDAWTYNSSKKELSNSVKRLVTGYLLALKLVRKGSSTENAEKDINIKLPWTALLRKKLSLEREISFSDKKIRISNYRPFIKQWLYYDNSEGLIERPSRWNNIFPTRNAANLIISINQGYRRDSGFLALMSHEIPDLHFIGDSQCFPRFIYRKIGPEISDLKQSQLNLENSVDNTKSKEIKKDEYIKDDAISDSGLAHFQEAYPNDPITKDDLFYYIYAILHSNEYRTKYANNLSKELPRIPRVATYEQFRAFEKAGRKLADLHINFEKQPKYQGVKITKKPGASYKVTQMKWGKIPGKTGNAAKDKTILHYNNDITIENIPLEAQEYVVNKKSALDWVVERCCISEDKASGIVNDFNLFGEEQGISNYPFELFLRLITVSLETLKIVNDLPPLKIHPLDLK